VTRWTFQRAAQLSTQGWTLLQIGTELGVRPRLVGHTGETPSTSTDALRSAPARRSIYSSVRFSRVLTAMRRGCTRSGPRSLAEIKR
jgi:hypothetical protein